MPTRKLVIVFVMAAQAAVAGMASAECVPSASSSPQTGGGGTHTPAAVKKDGAGTTGWTGGTGGASAGTEQQKADAGTRSVQQPEEAKGLDLKKSNDAKPNC